MRPVTVGETFLSLLFVSQASSSLHPAPEIWNHHDGMRGASLLGLHEYNDEHHHHHSLQQQPRNGGTPLRPGVTGGTPGRKVMVTPPVPPPPPPTQPPQQVKLVPHNNKQENSPPKMRLIRTESVLPAYENTVNPFLSHVQQGWRVKPVRRRRARRKLFPASAGGHTTQEHPGITAAVKEDLFLEPLPLDPTRPHFRMSGEVSEGEDDNRSFGNEEKDLGDIFHVLFSSDY